LLRDERPGLVQNELKRILSRENFNDVDHDPASRP
jgi:hypothetical protein